MENISFRSRVLLSTNRALWGMIYPSIRAIAIGWEEKKKFTIIYYLDREPITSDYANIKEVTSEICADIPEFESFEEICRYTLAPFSKLKNLDSWVYIRKEDNDQINPYNHGK